MDKNDYDRLHEIVFRLDAEGRPTYPGYRPEVLELPNGDGKVDAQKRYAHVATKYLRQCEPTSAWIPLNDALFAAQALAQRVALALGVPYEFRPVFEHGALRVLEYPVGATSALHTDFDLFTLILYRDQPECFVAHDQPRSSTEIVNGCGIRLREARKLNAQLHIGELGELIGLGPATPHEVIASDRPQHSIVHFAVPDHAAVLPTGQTVGNWIAERYARSRAYK